MDQMTAPSPNLAVSMPQLGVRAVGTSKEPHHLRQKDKMPLRKSLKGSQQEALPKIQIWCNKLGRATSRQTTLTSTRKPHIIYLMSCSIWFHRSASQNIRFTKSKRPGQGKVTYSMPVMLRQPHQRVCDFFTPCHLQNCPRLWAWQAFITLMPFAALPVWPFALGVGKRVRMKGL